MYGVWGHAAARVVDLVVAVVVVNSAPSPHNLPGIICNNGHCSQWSATTVKEQEGGMAVSELKTRRQNGRLFPFLLPSGNVFLLLVE